MRQLAAIVFVFLGGFAVMVLEIVGARFLARDFGNSFYVWVSQIGVILGALAAGYYLGGALADRLKRASKLAWLLVPAGIFTDLTDSIHAIIGGPINLNNIDALALRDLFAAGAMVTGVQNSNILTVSRSLRLCFMTAYYFSKDPSVGCFSNPTRAGKKVGLM
jgi:hypothetical protein